MNEKIFYSEYFYEKGSKDTESLEKNVRDYPFSSLANFLLLYHYKKINHPDFDKQAKKTALLFGDANWLGFQMEASKNIVANGIIKENINQTSDAGKDISIPPIPDEFLHLVNDTENISVIQETTTESVQQEFLHEPTQQTETIVENNFMEEQAPPPDVSNNHDLNQNLNVEEKPDMENAVVTFEPLHTVDYFASQGIKLNEDILKNDKLVNQVKSFTAWLKTMKKINPSKLEEQPVADEQSIQTSAEESNINTEVLTEAMAEVLIKQNKHEKAIEMFSKLSLINPAKSAYFASRIEQIKSTL